jgi:hypothetical protein
MNSFDEILETAQAEINASEELAGLTSNSRVSVWYNFMWIICYIIDVLRQMFGAHKTEIDLEIKNQKRHSLPEVRKRLLKFQYGFDLIGETDEFDNTGATDDEIENSKIIKYAAVTESDDEKRVICKIATETAGELSPIEETHLEAFAAYVKEIRPPGVPYTVINYLPDLLNLNIRIFRDPLQLDANGVDRINGTKPVEIALQEFMKELPFNGELRLQELADKLQKTDGVNLVQIDSALSAWLNAETGNYGDFTVIDVRRIPVSGYFKIVDFNGITYAV